MKKVTLVALVIFVVIVGSVTTLNLLYPPNAPTPISNPATTTTSAPTTNYVVKPPIIAGQQAATIAPQAGNTITMADASKHSANNDCYLVIKNVAYDVSSYISSHPGGRRTITDRCGKEVTGIFAQIHSNRAWNLLGKYKVADISDQQAKTQTVMIDVNLTSIQQGLAKSNPNAEIISVSPKKNLYIAKVSINNEIYEVHLDKNGNIVNEEKFADEQDWNSFETDADDN